MDEATARPWTARKPIDEDAAYIDGPGRFDLVARVASSRADAALIVEAVNAYDRLRAIEAAARAYVAWQYRVPGAPRVTLSDLRAALEVPSDAR